MAFAAVRTDCRFSNLEELADGASARCYFPRMKQPLIRLSVAVLLVLAAACSDARVKKLDEGITRDSVLAILRDSKPAVGADSLPHVYEDAAYLVNGRRYEVFYYTKGDEVAGADSLPAKKLTPIVFVNGNVTGWGWKHWDSVATSIKLPVKPR